MGEGFWGLHREPLAAHPQLTASRQLDLGLVQLIPSSRCPKPHLGPPPQRGGKGRAGKANRCSSSNCWDGVSSGTIPVAPVLGNIGEHQCLSTQSHVQLHKQSQVAQRGSFHGISTCPVYSVGGDLPASEIPTALCPTKQSPFVSNTSGAPCLCVCEAGGLLLKNGHDNTCVQCNFSRVTSRRLSWDGHHIQGQKPKANPQGPPRPAGFCVLGNQSG